MPIPLGTNADTQINAINTELSTRTSTRFASLLTTFLRQAFRSTTNVFGTASQVDSGTSQGDIAVLGSGGTLPGSTLPQASETIAGASARGSLAEHTTPSSNVLKHATPRGVAAMTTSARSGGGGTGGVTFFHIFTPTRTPMAPLATESGLALNRISQGSFVFTPPAGTERIVGFIIARYQPSSTTWVRLVGFDTRQQVVLPTISGMASINHPVPNPPQPIEVTVSGIGDDRDANVHDVTSLSENNVTVASVNTNSGFSLDGRQRFRSSASGQSIDENYSYTFNFDFNNDNFQYVLNPETLGRLYRGGNGDGSGNSNSSSVPEHDGLLGTEFGAFHRLRLENDGVYRDGAAILWGVRGTIPELTVR